MREKNEVIMIYADADYKDIGVLQDYSFDECYGVDENNFECKIQKYNPILSDPDNPIGQDFILYIEFTEYGGIIDRIESDTKSGEVTLSGRTWHGFLNSFVIEPPKNRDERLYAGEANAVVKQMLIDAGVPLADNGGLVSVSTNDSGVIITATSVRYGKLYDTILKVLTSKDVNAKLTMYYQDKHLYLEVLNSVNTGVFEEFDTSQVPLKVGKTYNNVTELLCLGQGNGAKRAVIHLYVAAKDATPDKEVAVLPYCRENPMSDADYYTDLDALSQSEWWEDILNYITIRDNMVTGKDRYCEIYDYPSAEITTNYVKLNARPADWNNNYWNYFRRDPNDTTEFEQLEKEYRDKYKLTDLEYGGQPPDWKTKYSSYYMLETNSSTEFVPVSDLPVAQVSYHPSTSYGDAYDGLLTVNLEDWRTNYSKDYYELVPTMTGYEYQHVQGVPKQEYKEFVSADGSPPLNWATNYGDYYTRSYDGTQWIYSAVQGIPYDYWTQHDRQPDNWATDYGNYYWKAKVGLVRNRKRILSAGQYYTVAYGIQVGVIDSYYYDDPKKKTGKHNYPKWSQYAYFTKFTGYNTPAYVPGTVFYSESVTYPPDFVAGKYYTQEVNTTPPWRRKEDGANGFGGYYVCIPNQLYIPEFDSEEFFYAVQDRYKVLIEGALERLREICDKNTLEVELDLESNYDVGDWICGMDSVTGTTTLDATKMIKHKIIKIKKGILSVDYEVE